MYRYEQWIAACLHVVTDCAHNGGLHTGFFNFIYFCAEMIRSFVLLYDYSAFTLLKVK
jgi:hypothetical protein